MTPDRQPRSNHGSTVVPQTQRGHTVYSPWYLATYDLIVLGFLNRFIWRCPTTRLLRFYNDHVSARHLDVGVATGYYLDRCTFPVPNPQISLLDLNPNSLSIAARRIRRFHPRTILSDVMQPLGLPADSFDSIGLSYLLHCIPGNLIDKAVVFDNVADPLRPGGVIFGSTILNGGVDHGIASRFQMKFADRNGIMDNLNDNLDDLHEVLSERFSRYTVDLVGRVALFTALKD